MEITAMPPTMPPAMAPALELCPPTGIGVAVFEVELPRSEERRVGKECLE